MVEIIMGIVAGFLTFLLSELRRRRRGPKISSAPPPADDLTCKQCFFYREFKRIHRQAYPIIQRSSDTKIIRQLRQNGTGLESTKE